MSQIDVSYGILHYNPSSSVEARDAFIRAVDSLAENRSDNLTSEVFIIDQGNPHREIETGQGLAKRHGFNFISLKENVGISRGINLIAGMARGRYVSLVTSDVFFTEGLDESLIGTLERHHDIWQICPTSDKSDIPYQIEGFASGGVVLTLAQELTIQFWPRHVFDKVGYYDERWKACYENLDYALRIFLAGGYAAISHEAFCPHDYHMCVRTGAREHSYDDYIGNNGEFDPTPLQAMWESKWPGLKHLIDLYTPLTHDSNRVQEIMIAHYKNNIFLPYVQNAGY